VFTPQIVVTVDYSKFGDSPISPEGSVKIWPSFTADAEVVLQTTSATTMIPGTSLIGSVRRSLRSLLKDEGSASFGFNFVRMTYRRLSQETEQLVL
jgi:hypothetical protein